MYFLTKEDVNKYLLLHETMKGKVENVYDYLCRLPEHSFDDWWEIEWFELDAKEEKVYLFLRDKVNDVNYADFPISYLVDQDWHGQAQETLKKEKEEILQRQKERLKKQEEEQLKREREQYELLKLKFENNSSTTQ